MYAVIFDLWNTLIKTGTKSFTERLADAMQMDKDYVLDYIRASSSRNSNVHYMQIVSEIWAYTHNKSIDSATQKKVEQAYEEFIADVVFIDGAEECLSTLKDNGYMTGIVSNATSVTIDVVNKLKIEGMVNDVFISCLTGYLKPDPRAFTKASDSWGIETSKAIVVGDKLTTDILGAKLAKMNVVWYAPDIHTMDNTNLPVDITGIISELNDVPKIADKYFSK